MNNFSGFFSALPTPFDTEGKLIEHGVRELVRHNVEIGMDGVYVGGSTGEAFLQEVPARKRVFDLVADAAPDGFTLMAHVGCMNTAGGIDLARHAEAAGYHAISSVPPFYYNYTFRELHTYFTVLAEATSLPLFIYIIPANSGVAFDDDQMNEILTIPNVAGIKFTFRDVFQMERIKSAHPEKCVLFGYDEMILAGLAMGADGGVGSTYNILGPKVRRLAEHFHAGRMPEALVEQREINEVITALLHVGVFQGIKVLLNMMGVSAGVCLPPFAVPDDSECANLRAVASRYTGLPTG
ncbi:MAG: N-acetylneuraminate lyase [Rhodospirillales bacterium]|nr:N-acetylneuraminate lyase [Rhodospirillales bacterium]